MMRMSDLCCERERDHFNLLGLFFYRFMVTMPPKIKPTGKDEGLTTTTTTTTTAAATTLSSGPSQGVLGVGGGNTDIFTIFNSNVVIRLFIIF